MNKVNTGIKEVFQLIKISLEHNNIGPAIRLIDDVISQIEENEKKNIFPKWVNENDTQTEKAEIE